MLAVTVDRGERGHLTAGWLLVDGAETEHGVQLERTVELCWSPLCPHIFCSFNNSPRCSSSASAARKHHLLSASVFLFPWITAGPASREVNIWAAKGRTQVESEICVAILHHRVWVWFTEAAISSEQEAGVVTTEKFWMRVDGGFWLWVRVHVLRGSSGGPGAVWWTGLLVCVSDKCLRLRLVRLCGQCVQGGGVTEQLKPGREEGLLSAEMSLKRSLFLICFHVKYFE